MPLTDQSVKRISKYLLFASIATLILYLSWLFFDLIVLVVIGLLVAMIFNPVVTWIENKGVSRLLAVLLVFILSSVIIFIGFTALIPKIASQLNVIMAKVDKESISQLLEQMEADIRSFLPLPENTDFSEEIGNFLYNLLFTSVDDISLFVSSVFSIIAVMIIVPFIAFFLLKDKQQLTKGIIDIMPNKYFEMSYSVLRKISKQLGKFVRAWILDATLVGAMAALGLTILGIDNSITIGFIAGLGHLIPYFGPIIGGLPAILISLIQFGDFSMLAPITVMFLFIYTFDNGYIQPNVFSKGTDLHPLIIILLILMGSKLMGVLGMLLAVPVATVAKTASREIYYGYKNYKIIRS